MAATTAQGPLIEIEGLQGTPQFGGVLDVGEVYLNGQASTLRPLRVRNNSQPPRRLLVTIEVVGAAAPEEVGFQLRNENLEQQQDE